MLPNHVSPVVVHFEMDIVPLFALTCHYPNSLTCLVWFAGLFASEEGADGTVFIDRDPNQFGLVLDYLRHTQGALWSVAIWVSSMPQRRGFFCRMVALAVILVVI